MKVLLISALPPPAGGIATWTERYLDYCKRHDISTAMVNIALIGDRGKNINDKTKIWDEIRRTIRVLSDMREQIKVANATVVHMNTSCGPMGIFRDFLCVKAACKNKIPVVLHFHCNVGDQVHGKMSMLALKGMTAMADRVLVLNSTSEKFVFPYSKVKPTIVPNFINTEYIEDSHIIRNNIEKVVYVGHVQKTKGCREILNAAEKLPDIKFILIGPVADEIAAYQCPQNVFMVGEKKPDEVKQYLFDADLFLFPSYTEGFSLSLTEAMASGLPAIATDVGANRDMLENKGGVIIPVHSIDAIVNGIDSLSSQQKRKEMSRWVINKAKTNYTTDIVMRSLVDIYQRTENRS